jgi:hypothetical protein
MLHFPLLACLDENYSSINGQASTGPDARCQMPDASSLSGRKKATVQLGQISGYMMLYRSTSTFYVCCRSHLLKEVRRTNMFGRQFATKFEHQDWEGILRFGTFHNVRCAPAVIQTGFVDLEPNNNNLARQSSNLQRLKDVTILI